jgi:hypothetical protein
MPRPIFWPVLAGFPIFAECHLIFDALIFFEGMLAILAGFVFIGGTFILVVSPRDDG